MDDVRLIDANAAIENADKRYSEWNLAMAAAEGNRQISMAYKKQELFKAVRKVIESCPPIDPDSLQLQWHKTAEDPPKAEDANEDGCVLSININPGDMKTTNWPWNMVAAFPDCLPVWMPLPKKPDGVLRLQEGKDGQG
ncbi:hypothetical protein [Faecalibacterium sp. 9]|uniref:hypothetical protein n=1 Tax=Faecalibacterium sp. 9 TaxID=3402018 RepID=UPI003AAA6D74